jgi:hypothetical protein
MVALRQSNSCNPSLLEVAPVGVERVVGVFGGPVIVSGTRQRGAILKEESEQNPH